LFGPDADKFKIASDIQMTRVRIYAGDLEHDYLSFFREKFKLSYVVGS
jgi:hypothetical protein